MLGKSISFCGLGIFAQELHMSPERGRIIGCEFDCYLYAQTGLRARGLLRQEKPLPAVLVLADARKSHLIDDILSSQSVPTTADLCRRLPERKRRRTELKEPATSPTPSKSTTPAFDSPWSGIHCITTTTGRSAEQAQQWTCVVCMEQPPSCCVVCVARGR